LIGVWSPYIMKEKISKILKSEADDKCKLTQIMGLAASSGDSSLDEMDPNKSAHELSGFRVVLEEMSGIQPDEVMVSPNLCCLLANEFARISTRFVMGEAKEIFTLSPSSSGDDDE
jgi:hypothetical protein